MPSLESRTDEMPCPASLNLPTDSEINLELFEPFERLVQIEIFGQPYSVPEKNTLLRCFQYLFIDSISYGGFCWNGTCRTCEVHYTLQGDGRDRRCLSCSTRVVEGMEITDAALEVGSRLG